MFCFFTTCTQDEKVESFIGKLIDETKDYNQSESFLRNSLAAASFDAVISLALAYDKALSKEYAEVKDLRADDVNQTLSQLQLHGLSVCAA